jgi:hypothetical protein
MVLAARVARTLRRDFVVVEAPLPAADAGVVVGDRIPAVSLPPRIYAVTPDQSRPVSLETVTFPGVLQRESLAPVRVVAHVSGSAGSLLLTLRSGEDVLDRVSLALDGRATMVDTILSFLPSLSGDMPLSLTAAWGGDSVRVDGMTEVRDSPWRLLFHDPRPSWMSTFVRRVVEADARFRVASRIGTSRGIATAAGAPPPGLDDPSRLAEYDAIVIGAAGTLSATDLRGLEAYLRRRGGTVVLLLDEVERGRLDPLLRATGWRSARSAAPARVGGDGGSMLTSAVTWPGELPPGGEALAVTDTVGGSAGRPVVWTAPVGAGRVVVSGALDAWHFRDPGQSGFAAFWAGALADAASASSTELSVRVARPVLRPGESTHVVVVVRDLVLAERRAGTSARIDASARLVSATDTIALALWPAEDVGMLRGTLRAPVVEGAWRVEVETDRGAARTSLLVRGDAAVATRAEPRLLDALVSSRGGVTVEAARSADLPGLLLSSLAPTARVERWHPMRSPWWIVPFALALGYEWWVRRRRGQA